MTAWRWLKHPSGDTPVEIIDTYRDPGDNEVRHKVRTRGGGWLVCRPSDLATPVTPIARTTDPDTSHRAAERVNVTDDQTRVLLTHDDDRRGLTDFELAGIHRRSQTSLGKRRGELRDLGLIEDTGQRRPAPSGASSIVWRITPAGIEAAERLRRNTA